jgi:hypothetical protein
MPPLTVIPTQIVGLDKAASEHRGGIDKVDAMLKDIGLALGFVPFEIHP